MTMLPAVHVLLALAISLTAQAPAATPPDVLEAARTKPGEQLDESRFALNFTPLTLIAASLWIEGDLHLAKGVSIFANVGGGALRQFGWDAGLRYYASGSHLVGFYVDLRYSGFGLPEFALFMHGPGVQLGYSWKLKGVALAIGAGLTTFFELSAGRSNAIFLGVPPVEADVFILAGVGRPGREHPSVMPALRFAIGPWF